MKSAASRYRSKRRYSESPRHNPPVLSDITSFILPGFGGYAVSRVVTRGVAAQVGKVKPTLAKHAGALAAVATFAGAWFLAHRWKPLARYHTPLVVGAGIAAIQSVFQSYVPRAGWLFELPAPAAAAPQLTAPVATGLLTDDGNEVWASYNDAFDQGVYANAAQAGPAVPGSPRAAEMSAERTDTLDDFMAELGADGLGMGGDSGIFSNN